MRISIITPSFRQVDYLRKCAASVADQAGDFVCEHHVQDGGGGEDFEAWASRQSFARVVHEPDDGMYDAINRGFRAAGGDILAWLNCDEQYLPGALQGVAAWFRDHPENDILFGDVVLVAPDGEPLSYRKAIPPLRDHIRHCFLPTYSAATFVRRRIVDEGRFLDTSFRAIADAVWIHGLLAAGYRAGVLNLPLAVFTQTGENLGQSDAGRAEARVWRSGSKAASVLWATVHRIRKFRAGCYRRRKVHVDLYLEAGTKRTRREAVVGEVWRTSTSP